MLKLSKCFPNIREDFQVYDRAFGAQGLWVMVVYRFGRWRYGIEPAWIRKPFSLIYKILKTVSQVLTGIDLPCEVIVGRRFRIDHFGGVIISGDAVFGDDVLLRNGVTVGMRRREEPGSPVIGNRVDIGAGAKLLGKITIGDDVVIGANAVVIRDVPSNSIAVGVPARILQRRDCDATVSYRAGGDQSSNTFSTDGDSQSEYGLALTHTK
jgi:serine O-acetyltransferase